MKIRVTLDLSDLARQLIAELTPGCAVAGDGMATRAVCTQYIHDFFDNLTKEQLSHQRKLLDARDEIVFGPLRQEDIKDSNQAVEYLRAQGKSDAGIRQWLLKQRALASIQDGLRR